MNSIAYDILSTSNPNARDQSIIAGASRVQLNADDNSPDRRFFQWLDNGSLFSVSSGLPAI